MILYNMLRINTSRFVVIQRAAHHFDQRISNTPIESEIDRTASVHSSIEITRISIPLSSPSMPYIIVRGNLASYDNKYPWRVLVSGLKADDIEGLRKFPCGGYCDECTIVYLQHPCVILSALEKLGYHIVASSSTSVKQDYNEYVWTMGKISYDPSIDSLSQTTISDTNIKL